MASAMTNGRRAAWLAVLTVAAIAAAVVALVTYPPRRIKSAVETRVTHWIADRLGPGASIESASLSWNSLHIHGLSVPLDRRGGRVTVGSLEASIRPLSVATHLDRWPRMIRNVQAIDVDVVVVTGDLPVGRRTDEAWLPKFYLSRRVFVLLGELDSLQSLSLDDLSFGVRPEHGKSLLVCTLSGSVARDRDGSLRLTSNGAYLEDSARTFVLTGELRPHEHVLNLQAMVDVPPGNLPFWELRRPALSTGGGRVAIRAAISDSSAVYSGAASLSSLDLSSSLGTIHVAPVRLNLSGDTLRLDTTNMNTGEAHASVSGTLVMIGEGTLSGAGIATVEDLSSMRETLPWLPDVQGDLCATLTLNGTLRAPVCEARVEAADVQWGGIEADGITAVAAYDRDRIEIRSCRIETSQGRADLCGEIGLGSPMSWRGKGDVEFSGSPSVFGLKLAVRGVHLDAVGASPTPTLTLSLLGDSSRVLGTGLLRVSGTTWVADIQSSAGPSRVTIEPHDENVRVVTEGAENLLAVAVEGGDTLLRSVPLLRVVFDGNTSCADVECRAVIAPDSSQLWTRVASEFGFAGRFDREDSSRVSLSGSWSGLTGCGEPFEGRADVTLDDRMLTVNRFFIDEAGELRGHVDLRDRSLDLNLDIADLSIARLPVRPAFVERMQMSGTISGYVRASGQLERPEWTASLALIDGRALGVSDYWVNFEGTGRGSSAEVSRLELGRGVRKIVAASGTVDFENDQITARAEIGSARAEDFVLALVGRTGILSGEMIGRGTVQGSLKSPDVEADFSIRDGKLLDNIQADTLDAEIRTAHGKDGEPYWEIPRFAFSKRGTYEFFGSARLEPRDGGAIRARIEGGGDLLDLLDQVDRTFRTEGSDSRLDVSIAGTVERPTVEEADLLVRRGRFAYPDATPGPVSTEIAVRVRSGGVVDSGSVYFSSGDQWIEIRATPADADSASGLQPLIIQEAGIRLGVLEVLSGENGMPLHLPGFMKPEWDGVFTFGSSGDPVTISAYGGSELLFRGPVGVRNARLTFPFVSAGSGRIRPVARWIVDRLYQGMWDLTVSVGPGNHYDVDITGLKDSEMFSPLRSSPVFERLADYIDHLTIDANIDPSDSLLRIGGIIADTTFHMVGRMTSSRGRVDYLDQTFTIDYVTSDFDETDVMPILEGRASTEGVDSLGRRVPVYLTMYQIDRETDTRQRRGRLENVTFVLETDAGDNPEQALRLLGYDVGNVGGKAGELVTATFARVIGRQWLDPLERRLERWTMLDEVALRPGAARPAALVRQQQAAAARDTLESNAAIRIFNGSQFTVGKYVTRDLFVTYTGELAEGQIETGSRLGLVHLWNLEYRMSPLSRDLVLDVAVEYDEIERKRDESLSLKYSFALEP